MVSEAVAACHIKRLWLATSDVRHELKSMVCTVMAVVCAICGGVGLRRLVPSPGWYPWFRSEADGAAAGGKAREREMTAKLAAMMGGKAC